MTKPAGASPRAPNGNSARAGAGAGDAQLRIQNEELQNQLQTMKESLESLEKVKFNKKFQIILMFL